MLIIVESPAKAKTISKIVGSKYVVKASVGHIRRITDDSKTKEGKKLEINGIDIDNDFDVLYQVDPDKTKVVSEIKALAKAAKDGVLYASDSDREGEAISWHLSELLGVKDKSTVQRLEFHEITKKAIDHAIANPRPMNMNLVQAQRARQVLDKMVGYKLSPVIWAAMSNYKLSAGRVQSPALRILCEREKEIKAFISTEYWGIKGVFINSKVKTSPIAYDNFVNNVLEKDEHRAEIKKALENNLLALDLKLTQGKKLPEVISKQEELKAILGSLESDKDFIISETKNAIETNYTRPPFITSTLQQAASSKLGMNPKTTMQMAQKLYEGVDINGSPTALITYMRTDSVSLSADSVAACRQFITKNFPDYLPEKTKGYKSKSKNAQEAHEAIRPTDPLRTPASLKGSLEPRLLKLYELIWAQTIACQMTDEKVERLSFELTNSKADAFRGSVAWTIHLGFKALYANEMTDLSHFKKVFVKGEKFDLQCLFCMQSFTQPPSRFSSASLIKKLEELGIGRPSTYASIISTLGDRGYVEEGKGSMQPTNLGMKVNDLLTSNFEKVTGAELTAEMEDNLDKISLGEKEYVETLREFWVPFKAEVEEKFGVIKENAQEYRTSATEEKCYTCGSAMTQKVGRFGEYYQCETVKEHMFPLNYLAYKETLAEAQKAYGSQTKGTKCSECKKELIVRVSKASLKPYLACSEYKVGNKHTVTNITFGDCPQCIEQGRKGKKMGHLVQKTSKRFGLKTFLACDLPIKECGYVEKAPKAEVDISA
jgi:DNA topoisomerase I